MIVLGIESSCDETALALLKDRSEIISSVIFSQINDQSIYGGVVPELASRLHLDKFHYAFNNLITKTTSNKKNNFKISDIECVAVCQGPGLIGSLFVGCEYAKGISIALNKPLVTINHVHAHLHAAMINNQTIYPSVGLVVSGGHTHLFKMKSDVDICLISHTLDDACGECFDKVAKMLGCIPATGAAVEKLAMRGDPNSFTMPVMARNIKTNYFSYSGLKTHMNRLIKKLNLEHYLAKKHDIKSCDYLKKTKIIYDLCASFQKEAIDQLIRKLSEYFNNQSCCNTLYLGGGVVANNYFTDKLKSLNNEINQIFYPHDKALCSDNAVMIAALADAQYQHTIKSKLQKTSINSHQNCQLDESNYGFDPLTSINYNKI